MKRIVSIAAMAALLALTGCKSGNEKKADAAWAKAQTLTGGEKLMQEKTAYFFYSEAMKASKAKASAELKNNFISAALARIEFIYEAEGGKAQAIFLIREDIDKVVDGEDILPEIKDQYATFIMKLANDAQAADELSVCMAHLETAILRAADKSVPQSMKDDIAKEYSANQLMYAQDLYKLALKEKSIEDIIRAEYYTHVVLNYDPQNKEAAKLLSETRKKLVSTYTAFPSVIEHKPDTALYNRIDTTDILLAVPTIRTKGSKVSIDALIYNYSYNAIRLKQELFYLLDEKGNKYRAKTFSSEKPLLDTEFETKMKMSFNKPAGKIKALVYESKKDDEHHYAPKYFF